jgi:peptide deformylase
MDNKTATLPIKIYGEPILRKKASKVNKIEKYDISIIEKMVETMYANEGIGLAAPQIGIGKQILVVNGGKDKNIIKLINPVILKREGEDKAKEGCLSIPEVYVEIKRPSYVIVEGLDEKGKLVKIEAEGLTARVLQHEIDHLNGILIVDYASPVSKMLVKRQLKKLRRL